MTTSTAGDICEIQVNTFNDDAQINPAVAMNSWGWSVIAWERSSGQEGIWAQIYNEAGDPFSDEFQINVTAGQVEAPAVAMNEDGEFAVTWVGEDSQGDGIFARLFDADGTALTNEIAVNETKTNPQNAPDIDIDHDGNFVVVWQSDKVAGTGQDYDIQGRFFLATGNPHTGEFLVSETAEDGASQIKPAVALRDNGQVIVVWEAFSANNAQLLNGSGVKMGNAFIWGDGSLTENPDIAIDDSNRVLIVWDDVAVGRDIYGQWYDSDNNPDGLAFKVNSWTSDDQTNPAVASVKNDNANDEAFVVAWQSYRTYSTVGEFDIRAQRFNTDLNPLGEEFGVNGYWEAQKDRSNPAVGLDIRGVALFAWQSEEQDGTDWSIYSARFDETNVSMQNEIHLSQETDDSQRAPALAISADGDIAAAWESNGQDGASWEIYARQFDTTGQPADDEFRVNASTSNPDVDPGIAMNDDGDFVIVWRSASSDLRFQLYTASGNNNGENGYVNASKLATDEPSVAMDSSGNFVVAWNSNSEVYFRDFGPNGASKSPETQVNTFETDSQSLPDISQGANGFVVVWQSENQDGSDWGIYGQLYDGDMNPVDGEFRVNSETESSQQFASVAGNTGGSFVVVWSSFGQDGDEEGVYAKRYNSLGQAVGSEFLVNQSTDGNQTRPDIAMDSVGNFIIVWQAEGGTGSNALDVFGRLYDNNGHALTDEFLINSYTYNGQNLPVVAMAPTGEYVVAWQSEGQDGDDTGVFAKRFATVNDPICIGEEVNIDLISYWD
ncbi:MAG: hypothetical protein H6685_00480 [Deltaproteobacteria bacterium]|nr:hypothetical protein [Deltaproteobacteria bacterium]